MGKLVAFGRRLIIATSDRLGVDAGRRFYTFFRYYVSDFVERIVADRLGIVPAAAAFTVIARTKRISKNGFFVRRTFVPLTGY